MPKIPKHYFERPEVPPPTFYEGKEENPKHYRYKIYLGETIRNALPFAKVEYDFERLPPMLNERYGRKVTYIPDILVEWIDEGTDKFYVSDVEINGGIHYKNKSQMLKNKDRKDLVYSCLQNYKNPLYTELNNIASYMIFEIDDFELNPITDLFNSFKETFFKGGLYPEKMDEYLKHYLA